ncbi:hypothetical protein [Nocardia brasiliensis]|uniref:hypothetical protein n=1 Tax=Nocardia brasiliensis TaxID=37326 RepID=UPI0018932CD9|nr:hypothetical protein [Nocardia brasiliensis]MBF6548502.1 hypothetical protein [Nocardia brasiliensis]
MSIELAAATWAGGAWTVFWLQLPVLVLALAVIIVAITALRRARQEDIPKVFEAFATAFGRRAAQTKPRRMARRRRVIEEDAK